MLSAAATRPSSGARAPLPTLYERLSPLERQLAERHLAALLGLIAAGTPGRLAKDARQAARRCYTMGSLTLIYAGNLVGFLRAGCFSLADGRASFLAPAIALLTDA